jgi:hypothetical protein
MATPTSTHRISDLTVVGGSPSDLRALVVATWDRFVDAFPARRSCLGALTVRGAWELKDRASYDPARRLVTVRIPGTAPNLQASLVHEFAHHLEFSCPEQRNVRAAFLAVQDLPRSASWFDGPSWETTPSEQFAEAVVHMVVGRPAHPAVVINPGCVALLRAWGRGDLTHGS